MSLAGAPVNNKEEESIFYKKELETMAREELKNYQLNKFKAGMAEI